MTGNDSNNTGKKISSQEPFLSAVLFSLSQPSLQTLQTYLGA